MYVSTMKFDKFLELLIILASQSNSNMSHCMIFMKRVCNLFIGKRHHFSTTQ